MACPEPPRPHALLKRAHQPLTARLMDVPLAAENMVERLHLFRHEGRYPVQLPLQLFVRPEFPHARSPPSPPPQRASPSRLRRFLWPAAPAAMPRHPYSESAVYG